VEKNKQIKDRKMATKENRFKWKGFISFFALFVIIILLFTGIVLYFKPPGRIANWSHARWRT